MSSATTGTFGSPVTYPDAVAHLSTAPEASPGVWLNTATLALAEAGAGVDDLLTFRRQVIAGGVDTLVENICAWMQVA